MVAQKYLKISLFPPHPQPYVSIYILVHCHTDVCRWLSFYFYLYRCIWGYAEVLYNICS